jgi:hypothetical protein
MIKAERQQAVQDRRHDLLNTTAHVAERISNGILVLTGLEAGAMSLKDRSLKRSLFVGATGVALAVAVRAISFACDLGVDAINGKDSLG